MFINDALAAAPEVAMAGNSLAANLTQIGLILLIFYFFMIRPQVKKAKQHFSMVEALKVGDRVMTKGGIYGKVTKLVGEEIDIEVAPNVNITINRMAVETLAPTVSKENEKTTKTPKKTTTKSKK
jgi:preprotein translocase subunit YajC